MTAIVVTNMNVDISSLFDQIPVVQYSPPKRRRGRRRKTDPPPSETPLALAEGSVVSMILRTTTELRTRGAVQEGRTGFKHSLTIQIVIDGQFMCARIPKTGKLHICGAKSVEQVQRLFGYLVGYMCNCETPVYTLKTLPSPNLQAACEAGQIIGMTVIVMRNSNTKLGFSIIRDLLRTKFSQSDSEWIVRPPNPEKDYPGVTIQRHVPYCGEMTVPVIVIDPTTSETIERLDVPYDEYIATQSAKNQAKERMGRYVTFLVFADGSIIVTGLNVEFLRQYYNEFMQKICVELYDEISEHAVQTRLVAKRHTRPPRPSRPTRPTRPSGPIRPVGSVIHQ